MFIKIVCRPIGEAPEWVRDAWIGLSLRTTQKSVRHFKGFGVLTIPSGIMRQIWEVPSGPSVHISGFAVNAQSAVDLLAVAQPEAAEWWRSNAPKLLDGRQRFVFDAAACSVVEEV